MEGLTYLFIGGALAVLFTVIIVYFGVIKSTAPLAFLIIVILTFIYPFASYCVLNVIKPVIDAYYNLYIGPLRITQITSVYAVVVWASYIFIKRRFSSPFTAADYVNILLLILIPVPLMLSPGFPVFESVFRLLSGWGFYWLARETTKKEEGLIESIFILSGIYPTIVGVLSLMGLISDAFHWEELHRLKAVYYDATAYGFELVPMWSVLLYRLNKRFNLVEFVLFATSSYLLYKTYTRALWMSAALAILITSFKGRFSRYVLLGALIFSIINIDEIILRFSERGVGTDPESFNGRIQLWMIGLQRFLNLNPAEMFFGVSIVGRPLGLFLHNLFLVFLFDYGILGAVVFTVWSVFIFITVFRIRSDKLFYIIPALSFAYVGGLTTSSFLYPNFQWFFMSCMGLLVKDHIGNLIANTLEIGGGTKPKKTQSGGTYGYT